MKKGLKKLVASVVVFGVIASGAMVADAKEVMKVSGSSAILKEAASPTSKSLVTLSNGSFVVATGASNGWKLVDYQGTKGAINPVALAGDLPFSVKISNSKGGIVIKQKPSASSATLATLKHGMVMQDYGASGNGYSFVRYGTVIGYAQTTFISAPKATVKYVNSALSLRQIASASGEITGSVAKHEKVEVYANIAGWSYIKVGKYTGYVPTSNLMDKLPTATVTQPVKTTTSKPAQTTNQGDASSGYYVIPGAPSHFKNCAEMNKYYPHGVAKSHPAYAPARDRDKDNWACER